MTIPSAQLYTTYSIVAYDKKTGYIGVAVQTHQLSVGSLVPWALPGIGAVATQGHINPHYGPLALLMLRNGNDVDHIIDALIASETDADAARRQVAIIDAAGHTQAYTGDGCIPEADHYSGHGYSVQANMMTKPTVIQAMRKAYEGTEDELAERMMAALEAAQREDGDLRGMQSAALKIVSADRHAAEWETIYDIRVDEHENPLRELARLVILRRAQLIDSIGHDLLEADQIDDALKQWREARRLAPELEELAFWQAVMLADKRPNKQSVSIAARIFETAFENHDRRKHWLELLKRLNGVNLLEKPDTVSQLLTELSS